MVSQSALIISLPLIRNEANCGSGGGCHSLDSIIVSHVYDEAGIFVNQHMDEDDYTSYLSAFMPETSLTSAISAIETQYPVSPTNVVAVWTNMTRDVSFTCNTRQLFDAYHSSNIPTYMMQYAVDKNHMVSINGGNQSIALHGSDLIPTFWSQDIDLPTWFNSTCNALNITCPGTLELYAIAKFFAVFAPQYQKHLVSHAINGNPNPQDTVSTFTWSTATTTVSSSATYVANVVQASPTFIGNIPRLGKPFFEDIQDDQTPNTVCDFWTQLAKKYLDPTGEDGNGLYVQDSDPRKVEL